MQLGQAKAQLVAALVRKTFVEAHIDFLTKLYQGTPRINPKSPSVPQENVVNLAKPSASPTNDKRPTTNDYGKI